MHDDETGWQDAPYEPGTYMLNIGDLMARWSGDRWRSGRHRVLPPPPEAPQEELTSLVYFHACAPPTPTSPRCRHPSAAGPTAVCVLGTTSATRCEPSSADPRAQTGPTPSRPQAAQVQARQVGGRGDGTGSRHRLHPADSTVSPNSPTRHGW
ncbi:2OG-Fe(II) oxygenase family protein [Streptomyces sp. NBC_00046]|uniref:2OG-Fe(II) oxygenase family protein n=1 Tax=Streptomyces sp. NBC_00046 TaxID=2975626 RepID=UPI00386648F4